ncbi:MAG: hypothetical protein COB49_11120 [Alphaproteobacteria bacterium]|nr:MAG: hypothetical protein COB49_11120 [Alphaproteobacteria bacterium]
MSADVDGIQDNQESEEYEEQDFSFSDKGLSDGQLDNLYEKGRFRLIQERNDFMLPQIHDYVAKDNWVNTRPDYQRRLRWSPTKKSALIESFLMNIPVPPVFLYEGDINRYEVMDGQQRISTIVDFYENGFKLSGLKAWPALNGKTYRSLPSKIKRGLDRAKISAHILLADSFETSPQIDDIRTIVFDRLNTGGEKLNAQELRNALYTGRFSKMLIKIASSKDFTEVWGIPLHRDNKDENGLPNAALSRNSLFKTMKDCEIVLRFYAFRDEKKITGSIRKILDVCAKENRMVSDDILEVWEQEYFSAIALCNDLFDDQVFRLPPNQQGVQVLSRPLSDALMVAAHKFANHKDDIIAAKDCVRRNLAAKLDTDEGYSLIVGRINTADSVKERITTMIKLFEEAINEHQNN